MAETIDINYSVNVSVAAVQATGRLSTSTCFSRKDDSFYSRRTNLPELGGRLSNEISLLEEAESVKSLPENEVAKLRTTRA